MKTQILSLFFCIFVLYTSTAKAQLHYFFDKKTNTKEVISFVETPLGTEIMYKPSYTAQWEAVNILKSPPKLGGAYTIQLANKAKFQLTSTLVNLKNQVSLKNLQTGKIKTFLSKIIYMFRGDNSEYLEEINIDDTGRLLGDAVWVWVTKTATKKFNSKNTTPDYPQEFTLTSTSPSDKQTYTLKAIENNVEYVRSFELTTPKGEKKVFFLEAVKYE